MSTPAKLAQQLAAKIATLPTQTLAIIAGVVVVLLVIYVLKWQRQWMNWRYEAKEARRARIAAQAEVDAEILLRDHGYHVMTSQMEHVWPVYLDGEAHEVTMRADFLVKRRGKTYVAEVKSGYVAPSINTAATRRQLLEYRLAYPVDGILLVDMEALEIFEVTFAFEQPASKMKPLRWFVSGALVSTLAIGVALLVMGVQVV